MRQYNARYEYIGCPICYGVDGEHCQLIPNKHGDYQTYDCYVCGMFRVSGTVLSAHTVNPKLQIPEKWRAAFSHRFRLLTDASGSDGDNIPMLDSSDIEKAKSELAKMPTPSDQLNALIRVVGDDFVETGKPHTCDGATKSRIGSLNTEQLNSIESIGIESGAFSKKGSSISVSSTGSSINRRQIELTLLGWEKYDQSRSGRNSGHYGFLAMQYGDSVLEQFVGEVLKPGVREGTGYEVIDLRDVSRAGVDVSRAGVIDNLLRQQLRDAAFVIVDLTHDNSGAYWEAGYAEGLGKPVVYICERGKFDKRKSHFDTNHCTTVPWLEQEPDAFKAELVATIRRSLEIF